MDIKTGQTRLVKQGDYIMRQGDSGESAYIIEQGRVEIILEDKNKKKLHFKLGPGDLFGEAALLANIKRTASAVALDDCKLITFTKEDFQNRLESADPILQVFTKVLIRNCRKLIVENYDLDEDIHPFAQDEASTMSDELASQGEKIITPIKRESALKKALAQGELLLYYQPIVAVETGKIAGFEALMRWNHPIEGMIPPDEFIPLAEDTGMIEQLSEWALKEATTALERMQALPDAPENLYMSVNFSSHDLTKPSFLEELDKAVQHTNLKPGQVLLEITERLLILKPEAAAKTLQDCRDAGFRIAIDDFGTGYSSLSYLQDFPIDKLKIDQAFIHKMTGDTVSEELVRTIIHLGKSLGMTIIAEGVETIEQARILEKLGCDFIQGYFFAYPSDEQRIAEIFEQWEVKQLSA